ncbi:aminotransferase class I and II [Catenulispora acidiphila DSM 44928]|uniref:Aminotransferase n=1 Tax=Catenulispora acidiphila (strain DSM 44928 / JCM 14897 / NBRC 102108 / NRRL B-24433 / ID139908) TaxID=479433 RepID=C7Q943_CATAD|nr:aminotransferase [Catenulispora acidiphila]ACU72363.1 aminotransferase class I and II [Catenulispora acidiphila DSM 44928]
MRLSARTLEQIDSPIGVTYALLDQRDEGRGALLDLAQAAPPYPAAPSVIEHIVATAQDPHGGDYVELTGLPHLREAFAAELSADYQGSVSAEQVLVTAGCNQAFCLAVSALAEPGDEVVLPLPYYFNHDMWLRLEGICPVYLDPESGDGDGLVPRAAQAEALITDRTRAIVLVTPGNPSGVTVPPAEIAAFADVAARHGIALILDETYRSFRDGSEPAHAMFTTSGWDETVVSLHSFSKDLAIPGYRVGAVVGSPSLAREIMKLMDCVAICPPRIGQEAAWAGLTTAREWRWERAAELAVKRAAFREVMADRPGGFELASLGGFFGWVRHPFTGRPTEDVVRELVMKHDTLLIPGTAFGPDDRGMVRVSVSNTDAAALGEFGERLRAAGV